MVGKVASRRTSNSKVETRVGEEDLRGNMVNQAATTGKAVVLMVQDHSMGKRAE